VVEEEWVAVAGMAVVLVGTVEATAIVATVPVARADLGVLRLGEAVAVVEGVAAGATVLEVTGPWEVGEGGGDCSNVGLRTRHGLLHLRMRFFLFHLSLAFLCTGLSFADNKSACILSYRHYP